MFQFGQEVGIVEMNEEDTHTLKELLKEYSDYFDVPLEKIKNADFIKLVPFSKRPYGQLYTY